MRTRTVIVALAILACASSAAWAQGANLTVSSPAFPDNGAIPAKYTCDGNGVSPPLAWSTLPPGTRSVAVLVDDPDAPHGAFVHWVVFDVSSATNAIVEGAAPVGAEQGRNGRGRTGWTPPCPPSGTHHYHFKVFALDSALALAQPAEEDVVRAMQGHVLAQGLLVGTYGRKAK